MSSTANGAQQQTGSVTWEPGQQKASTFTRPSTRPSAEQRGRGGGRGGAGRGQGRGEGAGRGRAAHVHLLLPREREPGHRKSPFALSAGRFQ